VGHVLKKILRGINGSRLDRFFVTTIVRALVRCVSSIVKSE